MSAPLVAAMMLAAPPHSGRIAPPVGKPRNPEKEHGEKLSRKNAAKRKRRKAARKARKQRRTP